MIEIKQCTTCITINKSALLNHLFRLNDFFLHIHAVSDHIPHCYIKRKMSNKNNTENVLWNICNVCFWGKILVTACIYMRLVGKVIITLIYQIATDKRPYPQKHEKWPTYICVFTKWLHNQTVNSWRVDRQRRHWDAIGTRHHLAWVLTRQLCLRLSYTTVPQNSTVIINCKYFNSIQTER